MEFSIPLTRGKVAIVDKEDYEWLSQWKWYAKPFRGVFYAARTSREDGTIKTVLMHRQILGLTETVIKGDHINHDTLDNRRSNIRSCSNAENCRNKGFHSNNKLKIKGVCYRFCHNRRKNFRAAIMVDGKRISLGYFMTASEAGKAYEEASEKYHGDFAHKIANA